MRRFVALALGILVATIALLALTLPTTLGAPLWHHTLALLVVAALALPLWPLLGRRRVVTLAMLYVGLLATATGFVMLYTRDFPRKEWITWWHTATSFAFTGLFLAHWAHNQPRLGGFVRRLARRASGRLAAGAWSVALVLGALSWAPSARAAFTREGYLPLASWTVLVGVALPYGLWLVFRAPSLRARLAEPDARNHARGLVDTSLWLACWLMLLTGFLILYFEGALRDAGARYLGKWWHTATSVVFLAAFALHAGFNARLVGAHARRLDAEMKKGD